VHLFAMRLLGWPLLAVPILGVTPACAGGTGDAGAGDEVAVTQGTDGPATGETRDGDANGDWHEGEPDLPAECEPACTDEQACIDGTCCDAEAICAGLCCVGEEVCSFAECVVPGDECVDASECPEDSYCETSLGDSSGDMDMCQGTSIATGKCLPSPPDCPPGAELDPNEALTCLPACEVMPDGSFAPELKYHVQNLDVMMSPIVTQLDDDNCDGVVDELDIPEIVFESFANGDYNNNGTLRAVSIVDDQIVEKWAFNPQAPQIHPGIEIAAGDVGGMPGSEIFVCTAPAGSGRVRAFNPDGTELWTSAYDGGCLIPSLADLDHDGQVELVERGGVLDALTGETEALFDVAQVTVQAVDLDGDGTLEIAGPQAVYEADGTLLGLTGVTGNWTAAGDFDHDLVPEIVVAEFSTHRMHIYHWDQPSQQIVLDRQDLDINGPLSTDLCPWGSTGRTNGGGPPTVADFNGDGTPDIAIAGGVGYAVLDGIAVMNPMVPDLDAFLWLSQTHDCSSAQTGSSVFDFDGDGSAEVVYSDEWYLRIFRGTTGEVLWQTCNTTGTLRELPVIADVDNDGQADIVVVSNAYSPITCENTKQRGVRVFGDQLGNWVRTRRIWNQHHYHVTNIEEDGTVPTHESPNWLTQGLNNFRQNVQPQGEFSAPDLIVELQARCVDGYEVFARVRNIGQAAAPAGVFVGFYDGDPALGGALLFQAATSKTLYPAEAEDVRLDAMLPQAIQAGDQPLWVDIVDEGSPAHPWHQCRTDNDIHHEFVACEQVG
jgi:hypothetical protein